MALKYTDKVMDTFLHPKNIGEFDNPDGQATLGNPTCGDQIQLHLKINKESLVIEDIKFKSYGCASNIATASIVTEMAKGKTLQEAKALTWKEIADDLGGLPAVKVHCSVLAVDTLKKAIQDYEETHGLVEKEVFELNKDTVLSIFNHIMNPATGKNIVEENLVKDVNIDLQNNSVEILLKLESDQYEQAITDEINDELSEHFKDLKIVINVN
jgi:NifU-like protein involved in Fe-S cluster formation